MKPCTRRTTTVNPSWISSRSRASTLVSKLTRVSNLCTEPTGKEPPRVWMD